MQSFAENRYEQVPYRRCGSSGLKLPAISLGFWQSLGEPGNEKTCRDCCYHAFDNGITHFDLANNYGTPYGNSEVVVGKVLRDMPRDELIISTKAGWDMWPGPYGDWGSRKYLLASLDQSLRRLGLDYVDIFYHHRPDPETPLDETMGALHDAVRAGKALYVGVSSYPAALFEQAAAVVRKHDWAPLTIHQPRYNLLERWVEDGLLAAADKAGTGVIAYSPLAQGRLTSRYLNGLPADSRWGRLGEEGRKWYEEQRKAGLWDRIAKLEALAKQRGQDLSQMALSWILRDPRMTSVIVGVSSVRQLAANLAAAKAPPLTTAECKAIDDILGNAPNRTPLVG